MKTIQTAKKIIVALCLLLFAGQAWATNIQFTDGPVIVSRNIADNEIVVSFSFGWDNSWNLNSPPNHDAAWVFMKFRPLGQHGFRHANLFPVEGIVHGTDGNGAGSTRHNIRYGASDRLNDTPAYVGVFLSRSDISVGSNVFENVHLHWDITGTGIDENTVLSVRIFAIEMVYIPMGTFASIHTMLETGAINTIAGTAPGGVARAVHGQAIHDAIAANPHWPLGTQPFYIMKHEVSQHAWVDFLNSLTLEQQMNLSHVRPTAPNNTRFGAVHGTFEHRNWDQSVPDFRHARLNIRIRQQAVGNAPAVFGVNASQEDVGPTVTPPGGWDFEIQGGNLPMFGLAWTDIMAYLDWAGLRPLTELEYEKAARGPGQVVAGEFAWGTTVWTPNQSFDNRNRPDEVSGTPGANMTFVNTTNTQQHSHDGGSFARWPIRVGAFARETTTRIQAGASFWGVLNLSDNVAERFIRFDVAAGQQFRGTHGDGNLSGEGMADVPDWPGVAQIQARAPGALILGTTFAHGSGFRGPGMPWNSHGINLQDVNTRTFISGQAGDNNWRDPWTGIRGGRSVPVEFDILAHPSTTPRATNVVNVASHAQGTVPVPWAAATHTLRISAVGGAPPYTIQWYFVESEPLSGEIPDGGTVIEGQTGMAFLPPVTAAHGPRFFFARVTDSEGEVRTTRVSGMHTVLGVATHPSTDAITTSLTQGTNVLTVAPAGGTPPFTVEWFVIGNGTGGAQGGGGTFVGNSPTAMAHRPILPIWLGSAHYTFWAQITDARGVTIRTLQSGAHIPGVTTEGSNRNVWLGPGSNAVNAWNVAQPNAGATADPADFNIAVALQPGVYRLEVWGASGGRGIWNTGLLGNSGWGGYTQAYFVVEGSSAQTVYIFPGGVGQGAHNQQGGDRPGVRTLGGLNGGGMGGSPFTFTSNAQGGGGGGGGASHISFSPGPLTEDAVRNNILIVAGGGGGGGHSTANPFSTWWNGFPGGGDVAWTHGTHATGGTQTQGGAAGVFSSTPAHFLLEPSTAGGPGFGGNSMFWHQDHNVNLFTASGGGGGGWFGGGGSGEVSNRGVGGGGGSGHIAPFLRHAANEIHPGAPAAGSFCMTGRNEGASGGIWTAGSTDPRWTPQHPSGVQNHNSLHPGAVRIIRVQ